MSPYEWKAAFRAERWATVGWILAAVGAGYVIVDLLRRG